MSSLENITILFMYQGAVPQILEKTGEDFFSKVIVILREAAHICYDRIMEIPCITCPNKPEGSMFVMVRTSNLGQSGALKLSIEYLIY